MSAALLKDAAWKLRGAVAALPVRHQCDWETDGVEIYTRTHSDTGERVWVGETLTYAHRHVGGETTAAYVVAMQPIVALYLADWLEAESGYRTVSSQGVAVANAILRGGS